MSPSCFGLPGLNSGSPASSRTSRFQRGAALRELAREARQHLPVDRDAAPFHPRQHRQQRTLQRLVHAHHMLGDHARLQHLGQAQRNIGVLGDVGRGLLERHVVEADLGFAAADHVVVVDRRVIEVARRQRVERMAEAAGIEHVGHQHGVLVRLHLDAAHREHLQLVFQVLADLEDAALLQQRFERGERRVLGHLFRMEPAAEQSLAVAALAVRERNVTGLVRRDRERDAAQRGLHRIDAEGLDVDRHDAGVVGARNPGRETIGVADDFVRRPVDLRRARGFQPGGSELLRRRGDSRRGRAGTRLDCHRCRR